jgi:hypothetical protein
MVVALLAVVVPLISPLQVGSEGIPPGETMIV